MTVVVLIEKEERLMMDEPHETALRELRLMHYRIKDPCAVCSMNSCLVTR
jgi:hypothetical protein